MAIRRSSRAFWGDYLYLLPLSLTGLTRRRRSSSLGPGKDLEAVGGPAGLPGTASDQRFRGCDCLHFCLPDFLDFMFPDVLDFDGDGRDKVTLFIQCSMSLGGFCRWIRFLSQAQWDQMRLNWSKLFCGLNRIQSLQIIVWKV